MNIRIIREEPVTPPVKEVMLILTYEEAKILKGLMGRMSGGGKLREFTDEIYNQLREKADIDIINGVFYDNNPVLNSKYGRNPG